MKKDGKKRDENRIGETLMEQTRGKDGIDGRYIFEKDGM